MADYGKMMVCPACGMRDLDLQSYASLLVLRPHVGLFTLECPSCQAKVTSIRTIPAELDATVSEVAKKLNAGMGCSRSQ